MTREMNPQDAIAAAIDDIRVVAAVLSRTVRHGVVGLDLALMAGGAQFLAPETPCRVTAAYTGAVDAALARLPGLQNRGNVISRKSVLR